MPRSGGTYTKVNTFTAGTTITAAGHNQNWDDAATELTNSIAADGQTTITGALKGAAGTVSLPGYSFSADLDCGMYRIGANNIGLAVNGAKVLDVATNGLTVTGTLTSTVAAAVIATTVTPTGQIVGSAGSVGAPSYSFTGDLDCGLYYIGTNNIGVAVSGAKVLDVLTTGLGVTGVITPTGQVVGSAGSVSAPSYSFTGDLDCGVYYIGTNNIGVAVNGAKVLDVGVAGLGVTGTITPTGQVVGSAASAAAPSYSFTGELDCGIFLAGANNIGIAVAASKVMDISGNGLAVTGYSRATSSVYVGSNASIIAGGDSTNSVLGFAGAVIGIYVGSGAPSISVGKGSLYLRTDGSSTSTRAYIATDAVGTWTALTTAA